MTGLDIWECFESAYKDSVTSTNTMSEFFKAELCPLCVANVCDGGLLKSRNDQNLISPDAMVEMKRCLYSSYKRNVPPEVKSQGGYVDT